MSEDEEHLFTLKGNEDEVVISKMNRLKIRFERSQRENRRLRFSASFRIGLHLTQAFRQPWRFVILPITFPLLILSIGFERLGRKPAAKEASLNEKYLLNSSSFIERKHCIVLFPTNGVGFGLYEIICCGKTITRIRSELRNHLFHTNANSTYSQC